MIIGSVFLKEKETLEIFGTLQSQLKGRNWGQTTFKDSRISPHFRKYQYLKIEKCVVRFFLLLPLLTHLLAPQIANFQL